MPWLVRRLRSAGPQTREEARLDLFSSIVHQGTRYPATAPAVPFLVELATAPDTPDRHQLVDSLAYAAVGRRSAACPTASSRWTSCATPPACPGAEQEFAPWALAAYQAVQDALPSLLPLPDDADDRLRRAAAYLLAWFPPFAPSSLPRLRARLDSEPNRNTKATMIVSVGLLAGACEQTEDGPWLSVIPPGFGGASIKPRAVQAYAVEYFAALASTFHDG